MQGSPMLENFLNRSPSPENCLVPIELQGKKVIIHYWEEFDSGKHISFELEVGADNTIEDLINIMIKNINKSAKVQKNSSEFIVRIANKSGLPKTDLPMFEIKQKVQNVAFDRFVVCDKNLDDKVGMSNEEFQLIDENQFKEEEPLKEKNVLRRIFCCICN